MTSSGDENGINTKPKVDGGRLPVTYESVRVDC